MKAVRVRQRQVQWADTAAPSEAAGNDLLIRVRAAALNGADRRVVVESGDVETAAGIECAGEVLAVGPQVVGFEAGDRVMGLLRTGGQAELALLPAATALLVPDDLDWDLAGSMCEIFTTAHDALMRQLEVCAGHRVLVQGASGGVGVAAIALATAAGAQVVASVRRPELRTRLRQLLSDQQVQVVAPDQVDTLEPFDRVLELVGGPNIPTDLRVLAHAGRIVVIGVSAGAETSFNLRELMRRHATLGGSTLKDRPDEAKGEALRSAAEVALPGLRSGLMRIPLESYPMSSAPAAYQRFQAGGLLGKIVLLHPMS